MNADPNITFSLEFQSASQLPLYSVIVQRINSIYQKVTQSLYERNRTPETIYPEFVKAVQSNSNLYSIISYIESRPKLKHDFEKVNIYF